MRVMLDTNVLISMLIFPTKQTRKLIKLLSKKCQIVLCDYILDEMKLVIERKFASRQAGFATFFQDFPFELIHTPQDTQPHRLPPIRDEQDLPILAAAVEGSVEVLITGDKDFLALDIETPRVMTMRDFLDEFGQ